VIARALAKQPEQRFQSAGDLGRAALAASTGDRAAARDTVVATGAAAPIEVDTRTAGTAIAPFRPPPPSPTPPPGRRSRLGAVGGLGFVLVAGALLASLATRGEPRTDGAATPEPAATQAADRKPDVTSVPMGAQRTVVVGAGGHVWTGRYENRHLDTLDPATGEPTRRPRPRIGYGLTGLARVGDELWALASEENKLVHLDARDGKVLDPAVTLPGAANAVTATKDAVYVAVTQPELDPGDRILEIDPDTGVTRQSIAVRDGVRRLAWLQGRLWSLTSGNAAWLIGFDPDRPRDRVKVNLRAAASSDLAVGDGKLWVTLPDADQAVSYHPRSERLANLETGRRPSGIVVDKGVVWVANRTSSSLTPIDVKTERAGEQIDTPLNPYDVAAYRGAIWVTCLADGRIARVTGLDD
jgi:streptogramin lyase